jgi:hypothetical protein
MWIVMTSCANMPASVKSSYRNVALVKVTDEYAQSGKRPKMISMHAKGVVEVRHLGHYHVGKTDRCAYMKAVADAVRVADELNELESV